MSGWWFVAGLFVGSVWTLVALSLPKVTRPVLRAKYTTFVISETGSYKIQAIKEIRAASGIGLREAKDASEGVPLTLERAAGDDLAKRLHTFGVKFATSASRRAA